MYIFLNILLVCFNLQASLVNYNLDLVSQIEIENADNNYGVSDVWGYTDETGIEYAIVGYQFGTYIYDVSSNPESPTLIADIIGPSSGDYYYHRDYKTYGDYLYIVNEMYGGDIGMQVVDLTPLPELSPNQLDTYSGIGQSHNLWIDPNGFAFIEHANGDNIHIVDLSNPSLPTYAGSFLNQADNCHDIYTKDDIAYVSEGWSYRFGIYDVSDLNNITELASIPCEGYAHNAWLSTNGTHLVTTEETENQTIKIWDITDLNNITLTGEYLGENNLAHNVHVLDDLVYISHYSTGLKIVDIYNPSRPIEVAAYDTYLLNDNGGYIGSWGAFPFTNNNYVYASDMQYGLYIFNFDNIQAGFINGYMFSGESDPIANATIRSLLNNKVFTTDINGYYDFGHPEGSSQFVVNEMDTIQILIEPRVTIEQNFYLMDEYMLGDINQDAALDVLDIVLIMNFILNIIEPDIEQIWLADLNQDDNINIQDIVLLVQLILNN